MGIAERRQRERERRRQAIQLAAWEVAQRDGWSRFSMEKVAAHAELGRATVYSYFASVGDLVAAMAEEAETVLAEKLKRAPGLSEALDVPVRFLQANPAAFQLLFPTGTDDAQPFRSVRLEAVRQQAKKTIARLQRMAQRGKAHLPADPSRAEAFLTGISMAGAIVPELAASTTLRRRWQEFCLGDDLDTAPLSDDQNDDAD